MMVGAAIATINGIEYTFATIPGRDVDALRPEIADGDFQEAGRAQGQDNGNPHVGNLLEKYGRWHAGEIQVVDRRSGPFLQ